MWWVWCFRYKPSWFCWSWWWWSTVGVVVEFRCWNIFVAELSIALILLVYLGRLCISLGNRHIASTKVVDSWSVVIASLGLVCILLGWVASSEVELGYKIIVTHFHQIFEIGETVFLVVNFILVLYNILNILDWALLSIRAILANWTDLLPLSQLILLPVSITYFVYRFDGLRYIVIIFIVLILIWIQHIWRLLVVFIAKLSCQVCKCYVVLSSLVWIHTSITIFITFQ